MTSRALSAIDHYNFTDLTWIDQGSHIDKLHFTSGFKTEIGELEDWFKKVIAYKKPFQPVHVVEECGDYIFFVARVVKHYSHILEPTCLEGGMPFTSPANLWEAFNRLYRSSARLDEDVMYDQVTVQTAGTINECINLIAFILESVNCTLDLCRWVNKEKLSFRRPDLNDSAKRQLKEEFELMEASLGKAFIVLDRGTLIDLWFPFPKEDD